MAQDELKPNMWILNNRTTWDIEHPKHVVKLENCDEDIIAIIPNDNSIMGCQGPMWTPEAIEFIQKNNIILSRLYAIDGISDGND